MAIPSSGPIALTTIQTEFGGANPISINEYYAGGSFVPAGTTGTNGAVPSSGQISFNQFYGTSNIITLDFIVVGAGSAGGDFAGGAAGAVITKNGHVFSPGTYTFTVGAGGNQNNTSSRGDNNNTTTVYNSCSVFGGAGGSSSIGSIVAAGGGQATSSTNVGANGGSTITVPSGATSYSNTANAGSQRGGCGCVGDGTSTYVGGTGVSITLGGVFTFNLAGGGGAGQYWNVGGATTSAGVGGTAGGVTVGGNSGRVAGDRSAGVNPAAGLGNPPPNQGSVYSSSSYWTGENGKQLSVFGGTYNTGSGAGGSARAEIIFGDGCYGVRAGSGGGGLIVIGYTSTTGSRSYGGTVINSGNYYAHIYNSTTTVTL